MRFSLWQVIVANRQNLAVCTWILVRSGFGSPCAFHPNVTLSNNPVFGIVYNLVPGLFVDLIWYLNATTIFLFHTFFTQSTIGTKQMWHVAFRLHFWQTDTWWYLNEVLSRLRLLPEASRTFQDVGQDSGAGDFHLLSMFAIGDTYRTWWKPGKTFRLVILYVPHMVLELNLRPLCCETRVYHYTEHQVRVLERAGKSQKCYRLATKQSHLDIPGYNEMTLTKGWRWQL